MELIQKVVDLFNNHSDPITVNWLLVRSIWVPMIILLIYFSMIFFITPYFMKSRKNEPVEMKGFLHHYNACIVLLNLYITLYFIYYMMVAKFSPVCEPVGQEDERLNLKFAEGFYVYLISKMLELVDSVIIILRNRTSQQGFLHIYHHFTMFLWAWMGLKFLPGGSSVILATVNTFFHFMIYLYFHLNTYEWGRLKLAPFRIISIIGQLVQFSLGIAHSMAAIFKNCGYPRFVLILMITYIFSFFPLFFARNWLIEMQNRYWKSDDMPPASSDQQTFLPPPPSISTLRGNRLSSLSPINSTRKFTNLLLDENEKKKTPPYQKSKDVYTENIMVEIASRDFQSFLKAPRKTKTHLTDYLVYNADPSAFIRRYATDNKYKYSIGDWS